MSASSPNANSAERRSRLLGAKLRGLVGDHLGVAIDGVEVHPAGAALVVDDAAWAIVDGDVDRVLGGVLAWAIRRSATSVNVIADDDTGMLARRAAAFSLPIHIWSSVGRTLVPALPLPLPSAPSPSDRHLALAPLITEAGATVDVEHGVVFGEVRGLEVCRVVDQPTVGAMGEIDDRVPTALGLASGEIPGSAPAGPWSCDDVILEVGVGAHDREAFRLVHGEIPTAEALASVVQAVERHRSADAPQHPLSRLAAERMLRWRIQQEPARVGLVDVVVAEPPVPRANLRDPVPCVAAGVDRSGNRVRVVCSVGADLELVPFVADVIAMRGDPVIVVVPSRDLLPITRELAGLLNHPVRFETLD